MHFPKQNKTKTIKCSSKAQQRAAGYSSLATAGECKLQVTVMTVVRAVVPLSDPRIITNIELTMRHILYVS